MRQTAADMPKRSTREDRLSSTAGILYVRAALKPSFRSITAEGGLLPFLHSRVGFEQIWAPHFGKSRWVWERRPAEASVTSGALGKLLSKEQDAVLSRHPTHAFVGIGPDVEPVLSSHDHTKSCFWPARELADRHDFSMLLWGCVEESPGFSTVHAAQYDLGLTQRHLIRLAKVWDYEVDGRPASMTAPEVPGCSLSFGKFYPHYEASGNLTRGSWNGVSWIFIQSARAALAVERAILLKDPRFVDCKRPTCPTCRLRLY